MSEQALTARSPAVTAAAMAAITVWGATPIVTKVAVAGLDPLAVGVLRTLLGALGAIPFIVAGRLQLPESAPGRLWLGVSACGGFVAFPVLFSLGLGRTSAGHGALIIGLTPIFTGLFAAMAERRLPGARWWLGCLIAVLGTVVLVTARFGLGADGATWPGDVMVLLGAMGAAAGYVGGAHAAREAGTWAVTFWGLVVAALALLPFALAVVPAEAVLMADASILGSIAYLAVGSSILAYAAWYWALDRGGIGRTGLAQFLMPPIGLGFAVVLLGEPLTWPMGVAACAILGGVALAQKKS